MLRRKEGPPALAFNHVADVAAPCETQCITNFFIVDLRRVLVGTPGTEGVCWLGPPAPKVLESDSKIHFISTIWPVEKQDRCYDMWHITFDI